MGVSVVYGDLDIQELPKMCVHNPRRALLDQELFVVLHDKGDKTTPGLRLTRNEAG